MTATTRRVYFLAPLTLAFGFAFVAAWSETAPQRASAGPKPESYWQVDDVRPGMEGEGRTVLKGTKIETFKAVVLGVLKNTSPGRDMILCRLSGLNLENTGIIQGMSGSPIYIHNKLLGAVAYAWPYGKEPIAGVTPFSQMHGYVEAYERRDLVDEPQTRRVGLRTPVSIEGKQYDAVTVAQSYAPVARAPGSADGLWMTPLQTPLCATGFTHNSLLLLRDDLKDTGLTPMQGGGAPAKIAEEEKDTPLQIGGPLAVAMVTGDFDLSGIGTVTHIEGNRVYGFGHPFFGVGGCDFPLMTGYIHTIYPRLSTSFKMGSPLKTVGVINADVSTCVAGWLGRKPDMMPMRMTLVREPGGTHKTFNVEIVRQRSLQNSLISTVLANSVDMEGELPEELTAELQARIEVEGQEPIILKDTFSGSSYSGGRAPQALYSQVTTLVGILNFNSYKPLRIQKIECDTTILPGRRTAEIESVELDSEVYEPGETVKATVFVRPYRGAPQRLPIALKLPADLPEGNYTAQVCDDITNTRQELRDNPALNMPQSVSQIFDSLKLVTSAKRTSLVVRVPVSAVGVTVGGKPLPNLPPSMVHIMGNSRRTGAQVMSGALVARQGTEWVMQGSESVRFTVTKNKKVLAQP